MASLPDPRSAYLHVPFCGRRCGYCNFAVVAGRSDLADDYLRAVQRELSWLGRPHPVNTLYIGGGTPTALTPEQLGMICRLATQAFPLLDGYEWTVEANPADVSAGVADLLCEQGVTRVSLGGQSLRPQKLGVLERDHLPRDVESAVRFCHDRGLAVALDLIFAAPGESLPQWEDDVRQSLTLRPEHVSTYGLTFEKGTTFWARRLRGELEEVDEETQRAMYLSAIVALTNAGYEHYEVSNFARAGQRSRHNQGYWAGDGYWAAGPGAARYVQGVRETNHRSTTTYLKRVLRGDSPVAEREELTAEQRARESLVFGLRQLEGVGRDAFALRTGFPLDSLAGREIARLIDIGMLRWTGDRLQLTREGLLLSDALWPELL